LHAHLKSISKRHAGKSQSKSYAGKSPPSRRESGAHDGPVVIKFNFDPALKRRLDIAQVHLGDRIRVNVRRVGDVNREVYFTFQEDLDSPQGALRELKTMQPFERADYRRSRGYYTIEVKIYPGNRWNIMPRSYV
jgi:hypothetical protein